MAGKREESVPFIRDEQSQLGDLTLPAAVVAAIQTRRSTLCNIGVQHAKTETEKNLIKLIGQFIDEFNTNVSRINDLRELVESSDDSSAEFAVLTDYHNALVHKVRKEAFETAVSIMTDGEG